MQRTSADKRLGATIPTARPPRSIRRTTTHDSTRPEGLNGPVVVAARARDVHTDSSHTALGIADARLSVVVKPYSYEITRLECEPADARLRELLGRKAAVGFRQAVTALLPQDIGSGSLRFQLLDDLPTALLVSGYAMRVSPASPRRRRAAMVQQSDMCAGWVTGGTLLATMEEQGRPAHTPGRLVTSPPAYDDAWYPIDPLPPHGMRRSRVVDIWEDAAQGTAMVHAYLLDSYMSEAGIESAVHEYSIEATVDVATLRFQSCVATAGQLPYPECPAAAASARRLEGVSVDGIRPWVRETFSGPSTCTHLNDSLRALEDVPELLLMLRRQHVTP